MRKFVLYLSKYCPVLPFKTRVKSPNLHNSRGKSARANWSFHSNFNTVSSFSRNRGKLFLRFQKAVVNSPSSKSRGKITISLQNRDKNAKAPYLFAIDAAGWCYGVTAGESWRWRHLRSTCLSPCCSSSTDQSTQLGASFSSAFSDLQGR